MTLTLDSFVCRHVLTFLFFLLQFRYNSPLAQLITFCIKINTIIVEKSRNVENREQLYVASKMTKNNSCQCTFCLFEVRDESEKLFRLNLDFFKIKIFIKRLCKLEIFIWGYKMILYWFQWSKTVATQAEYKLDSITNHM